MIRYSILVLAVIMSCRKTDDLRVVKDINDILLKQKGTFAIAFKNLDNGEMLLINEHERFHAASTMKTPVMVEVFSQAQQGKFSLDDSLIIKNEFKSIADGSTFSLSADDDSEQELYKHLGARRTIRQLVYDMIISSSNLATNMIIELVGAKNVTASMQNLGAKDLQVLRGVEDTNAFERGMNNVTTAYDLMLVYERIATHDLIGKDACIDMENILLDQKFNEIIPAQLPSDVRVAHKTGNITGVRHDSGIVMLPDGKKYVLVLLSKELEDEQSGVAAMASVSKVIYDHVVN